MDGVLTPLQQVDSDTDGLDDDLEQVLGLNVRAADSDADGFSDALEFRSGANAMDIASNPLLQQSSTNALGTATAGATSAIGVAQVPGGQLSDPTDLQ
jgi:hypothetical protein